MINIKELDMLDIINILSFIFGILNYGENLGQSDKQDLMGAFDTQTKTVLSDIHNHLKLQDNKIDKILEVLSYDKN